WRQKVSFQRAAFDSRQLDACIADLLFGERDPFRAIIAPCILCGVIRSRTFLADSEQQRPTSQPADDDKPRETRAHARSKKNHPTHPNLPAARPMTCARALSIKATRLRRRVRRSSIGHRSRRQARGGLKGESRSIESGAGVAATRSCRVAYWMLAMLTCGVT